MMRTLLATNAYNANVQHIARALHEAGALGAYHTGCVDHYRGAWSKRLRRAVEDFAPGFDQDLRRRRISTIPETLIHAHWRWEGARTLAGKLGLSARVEDWLWERGEFYLDRKCARLLEEGGPYDVFFGVEHGALWSISAARRLGKKSVVAFLSPHHSVHERWIEREYDLFPELMTPSARRLAELARRRDGRRDEEARLAAVIYANSGFTARSLAAAGFPEEKIVSVPLGGPPVIADAALPSRLSEPLRVIYAGSVSIGKGTHYLIEAWRKVGIRSSAELHLYGRCLVPQRCFDGVGSDIVLHGVVSQADLFAAFRGAAILVLPTLCDGFGSVVSEAMANGLPVITTTNAGAADLIEEGLNGFVVPPADPESLAERIDWCLQHPRELIEMRRHAVATARRWTWTDFRAALRLRLARTLGEVL